MDGDERRNAAYMLTIMFVIAITGFGAVAALYKVNKKIVEPASPHIVDVMSVPTTKAK